MTALSAERPRERPPASSAFAASERSPRTTKRTVPCLAPNGSHHFGSGPTSHHLVSQRTKLPSCDGNFICRRYLIVRPGGGLEGIEPSPALPQSAVLPLHHSPHVFLTLALARIRTRNTASEALRDIHFTTRAPHALRSAEQHSVVRAGIRLSYERKRTQ